MVELFRVNLRLTTPTVSSCNYSVYQSLEINAATCRQNLILILFLSLFVFAITFTVKQTALNPAYAVKVINEINFSQAIQESINQRASGGNISPQLQTALTESLQNMEPIIKQQLILAIENTYASLKGQGVAPNLENTLS